MKNLIYVGTNPQVQEDHGDDDSDDEDEEDAHLQDDTMHYEAGGQDNNDRWA